MGLQDRDYYKEKLKEIERNQQTKKNVFIFIIVILLILILIFSSIIF